MRPRSLAGVVAALALTACSDSNAPEVVTSYTLRYYVDLDLEQGVTTDCQPAPTFCSSDDDLILAYNATKTVPAVAVQNQFTSEQIAHLTSRTFASVHLADTAGAGFTTQVIDQPFDDTRVILILTAAGHVYKLGNPVAFGPQNADSVRFDTALLK